MDICYDQCRCQEVYLASRANDSNPASWHAPFGLAETILQHPNSQLTSHKVSPAKEKKTTDKTP